MSEYDADYVEQIKLTEKQSAYVDHYMTNGFNKRDAFIAAGYKAPESRVLVRISKLHSNPIIQAEIARRQVENRAELKRFSPLEVMSANLDFWYSKAIDETLPDGDRLKARAEAQTIAKEAAPYVHPRLQAVAVRASLTERDLNEYSDDELDFAINRIEQALEIRTPVGTGETGKGKTTH